MSQLFIAYALAYFTASLFAFGWVLLYETAVFDQHPVRSILVPGIFGILGGLTCLQALGALRFKSVRTDENGIYLEFKKYTTDIPFRKITEVEIIPSGEILIYTNDVTGATPYAIAEEVSNQDILEMHLGRKVTIQRPHKLPLFFNPLLRYFTTAIAYIALCLHFVSDQKLIVLGAGIAYIVFAVANVLALLAIRHKGKGADLMTIASVCAFTIIVLVRIIINT